MFEIDEFDPEGRLTIGDFTVTIAPTVHFVPCWAMRVQPGDGSGDLVYTADTGPAAELAQFAAGARVMVAEATTPPAQRDAVPYGARGHLTVDEAAALAAGAGAATLVLTHMFEEHDPPALAAAAGNAFPGEIVVAVPGATVSWS